MESITFRISGQALLMHNIRLANPLDEHTKRLKAISSIRKKTDENLADLANAEFEGALYYDEAMGPYIPGIWLDAALFDGAKLQKNGGRIKQAAITREDKIKLFYDGPRDLKSLMREPRFHDVRAVGVMRAKVMRCRPKFTGWAAEFTVDYDAGILDKSVLVQSLQAAGRYRGIGDFRPHFGRFDVEVVKG